MNSQTMASALKTKKTPASAFSLLQLTPKVANKPAKPHSTEHFRRVESSIRCIEPSAISLGKMESNVMPMLLSKAMNLRPKFEGGANFGDSELSSRSTGGET